MNQSRKIKAPNVEPVFKVLLVDDNSGDIDLVKEAIIRSEFPISLSVDTDGVHAMNRLKSISKNGNEALPDLILLDLNLPKKDGRDILAEVKNTPELKSIPVVVLTSSDSEIDIQNCYQLGAYCYFVKPTGFREYKEIIQCLNEFWLNAYSLPLQQKIATLRIVPTISKRENEIHVLLIEDNEADVDLVKIYLRDKKDFTFHVHHFFRMNDAVLYAQSGCPVDVILSDLGLPDSHGLETLKKLYLNFPNTPIVILSGDAEKEENQSFTHSGTVSHIFKVKGKEAYKYLNETICSIVKKEKT